MMKNDLKNKLIQAANKQEISDLSDNIISKVDITKVKAPVYKAERNYKALPFAFGGIALASAVVAVGVAIGLNSNNGTKPTNNGIIDNGATLDVDDPVDFTDITSEETRQLLSQISTRETYNMINAAYNFNNITFGTFETSEDSSMTPSMEEALANDFNDYIYNIEDMFNIVEPTVCAVTKNKNINYDYSYDLEVRSPYYNYHIYYSETYIEKKNENQVNYKENSTLVGVIVLNGYTYNFETSKTIKNDNVDFNTKIIKGDNQIELRSLFTSDRYKFTYTYKYGENVKDVYIEQKIKDGNTTEIEFNSRNKTFQLVVKAQEDNSLECKIKSRNDSFTVVRENNHYNYLFKNSQKIYSF